MNRKPPNRIRTASEAFAARDWRHGSMTADVIHARRAWLREHAAITKRLEAVRHQSDHEGLAVAAVLFCSLAAELFCWAAICWHWLK